ncbi:MAG: hypothetical protein U0R50_13110 [Gaiellales bacterium]
MQLRVALRLFPLVVTALVIAVSAPPAFAKKTCAQDVIDDWYGNSRVDRRYPEHCYREAIASLSPDQKDYLHAEDDILRALAYRKAGKPDPGPRGERPPKPRPAPKPEPRPKPVPRGSEDPGGTETVALPPTQGAEETGIPLPLILLGGLAVTLLVAGGVGALARRGGAPGDGD